MKKLIYSSLSFIALVNVIVNPVSAQTWNIPSSGSTVGTNFLGTTGTGSNDFVLKSYGTEMMRFANGKVLMGVGDNTLTSGFADVDVYNRWSPAFGVSSLVNDLRSSVILGIANGGSQINSIETTGDAILAAREGLSDLILGAGKSNSGNIRFTTYVGSSDLERMTILNDGKVTIGTPTSFTQNFPGTYKLYVEDGILTEKLKIAVKTDNVNWSDFVFAKGYKLMPLFEVEKYINKNQHLPEVPSAKEIYSEGLDVAQMDAKLLQKIEELTLYMIEMKKQNEKLINENKTIKIRLKAVEKN